MGSMGGGGNCRVNISKPSLAQRTHQLVSHTRSHNTQRHHTLHDTSQLAHHTRRRVPHPHLTAQNHKTITETVKLGRGTVTPIATSCHECKLFARLLVNSQHHDDAVRSSYPFTTD